MVPWNPSSICHHYQCFWSVIQCQQGLERLIRKQQVFEPNSPRENWRWLTGYSTYSFSLLQFSFLITVKSSSSCLGWRLFFINVVFWIYDWKPVLVTQCCFDYCWAGLTQHQSLFCFPLYLTSEEAGGTQGVWKAHRQNSWPQMTAGTPHKIRHHAKF